MDDNNKLKKSIHTEWRIVVLLDLLAILQNIQFGCMTVAPAIRPQLTPKETQPPKSKAFFFISVFQDSLDQGRSIP